MTNSEKVSEFRRRRKLNLIHVCGDKCNLCGYNRVINSLEFHHINPQEKEYGIAANGTCHNLEKDLQEVKKCILVCANCHREIHAGLYSFQELQEKQIFNQDIADKLILQKKQQYEKKEYFCINCGKPITSSSKTHLCASCSQVERRVVQERPSREELKQLIQNYSFVELGRQFGVSDNAIRKWCKQVELPFRKKDIQQIQGWEKI